MHLNYNIFYGNKFVKVTEFFEYIKYIHNSSIHVFYTGRFLAVNIRLFEYFRAHFVRK